MIHISKTIVIAEKIPICDLSSRLDESIVVHQFVSVLHLRCVWENYVALKKTPFLSSSSRR